MAEGVDGAIALIDEAAPTQTSEVADLLHEIRSVLVNRPEWSEVVESNLRAEVATARRELAEHQLQVDLATVMFEGALRLVTEQRDQARRVAVSLEQELAETQRKLGLWLGGERAL
jgi:hypothetical protein